jgi:ATP-dependent RNA helicase RhlE
MTFDELGLREELLRAIKEGGYEQPTPIQEQAIPQLLAGRDLICCAQTGTGKTAAFALPILQKLAETERATLRALILVPTRELALQLGESLREYGRYLDLVTTTVFGGVPIDPQERMLRRGVDILVATPGRLKDHIWRGNIDFRNTAYLVLDEADRMLDMGFIKAVREIVELLPNERQSLLFSATLDQEIRRFSKDILKDPLRIEVDPPASTLEQVEQFLVRTSRGEKRSALETLIRRQTMTRTIIFARTKSGASRLAMQLRERGHRASAIHSDRSQSERIRALEGFRAGQIDFLVATDIAARGIDVDDVSHVVNYDLPFTAKDYVHRIGRTARAGRKGMAISLVTPEDERGVIAIERLISKRLSGLGETPERGPQRVARCADPEHAERSAGRRPAPTGAREYSSARHSSSRAPRDRAPREREASRREGVDRAPRERETSWRERVDRAPRERETSRREGVDRAPRERETSRRERVGGEHSDRGGRVRVAREEPAGVVQTVVARLKSRLFAGKR